MKKQNTILQKCLVSKRIAITKGWGSNRLNPDYFINNSEKTFPIGEVFIYDEEKYSHTQEESINIETVKALYIAKNKKLSLHFHLKKRELFFMAKGSLNLTLVADGLMKEVVLKTGQSIFIPPGMVHQMEGLEEENILIEVSTQDCFDDSYRISKGD